MSGAAVLWELYGVEVLPEGGCCRVHRERPPVRARDRRRRCLLGCDEKQKGSSPEAVCITQGAERLCMREHGASSRLKLRVHAAHRSEFGGERRSSCAGVSRSMTCIGPPQSGHFGRLCDRGAWVVGSVALLRSLKQSGSSVARCRLARKPKLRMRTKPRGSRCRRKRRRNSSTGRLIRRFLLPWAESLQRKLTLPSERATSLLLEMPTRWVYAPRYRKACSGPPKGRLE